MAEATFDALPFDADCGRADGLVYAEAVRAPRKARVREPSNCSSPPALAASLPRYTANPVDFAAVATLIELETVTLAGP